jgi:hypothetical protein
VDLDQQNKQKLKTPYHKPQKNFPSQKPKSPSRYSKSPAEARTLKMPSHPPNPATFFVQHPIGNHQRISLIPLKPLHFSPPKKPNQPSQLPLPKLQAQPRHFPCPPLRPIFPILPPSTLTFTIIRISNSLILSRADSFPIILKKNRLLEAKCTLEPPRRGNEI